VIGSCFGTDLLNICLTSLPTDPVTLASAASPLDTGIDTNCRQIVPQSGGPELCVISGPTVTVSGTFVAIGARPLVLIGTDTVSVSGTLDVSSTIGGPRKGAGANTGTCPTTSRGTNDSGGGGGGAGGSFGTAGGKGGTGDLNNNFPPTGTAAGGTPGAAQATPSVLHGGCAGGSGGEGDVSGGAHPGGAGGDGGGAVYLIAGHAITIPGDIFASGAGGGVLGGSIGFEQGGGGGGAGGMIGLDAPMIGVQGHVVANGGAGGGAGGNVGGTAGADGTTLGWNVRAAKGTGDPTGPAGDGAQGTAINATDSLDGGRSDAGGGGGAGGLGLVWIHGTLQGGTMISPAPVIH